VFDIGGLAVGQDSVPQINGAATFSGGNIEFDFIGGYKPSAGNFWDFLFGRYHHRLESAQLQPGGFG
jgi:hypothetical protein